jgi:3D (Asp-Asp-Asp) domain-containing protein/peptidoglycan hydrolase CwlO-like protein
MRAVRNGFVALLCAAFFALVGVAGGSADTINGLQQQAAYLQAQEHSVLLSLYSLDSRIDETGADIDRIDARLSSLRRQRADASLQRRIARKTLAVAERRLGRTLVALYASSGDDPLAVILGATSFADAVDGMDNLTRIASSHATVAHQAATARRRIAILNRSLSDQTAETRRLAAAAEIKRNELEHARGERNGYLAAVRAQSAQIADRIAVVEAEARAAQARAKAATVERAAAGSVASFQAAPHPERVPVPASASAPEPAAPAPEPAPAPVEPAPIQAPPSRSRTMEVTATAYSGGGSTATGIPVGYGVVAVDPAVIPLGTRMTIPGYGEGVAADTGSGVTGAWIDVWLPTEARAAAWGTQTITITLH